MKKYKLFYLFVPLFIAGKATAQNSYNERARKYVREYYQMAMAEQRTSGIPAAITLGQGILETDAGISELKLEANNHFGIKCKSDWTGETFAHDDDAPGECFKKYKDATESFKDHSDLLRRNPRYAPLFKIPITNYSGWAMTLRKCGYATNPQYGQRLIKIIEEFDLQQYTHQAFNEEATTVNELPASKPGASVAPTGTVPATQVRPALYTEPLKPESGNEGIIIKTSYQAQEVRKNNESIRSIADSTRKLIIDEAVAPPPLQAAPRFDSGKTTSVNNLKAFYARKGEHLLQYAIKYNVRYPLLLEMNDLPDAPLPFDTYVYLQRKHAVGLEGKYTVKQGESLLMIAQMKGIQVKRLRVLNHLNANEEPVVGTVLELQGNADRKPQVITTSTIAPAHKANAIATAADTSKAGYITLNRPKKTTIDSTRTFIGNTPAQPAKTEKIATGLMKPKADTAKRIAAGTKPVKPGINLGLNATRPATTTPVKPAEPVNPLVAPDTVIGIDEKRDWAAMHWVAVDTAKTSHKSTAKQSTTNNAELAKLKAELDKLVYADNSKLENIDHQYKRTQQEEAPAAVAASGNKTYTVKKGDTAFSIAKKHNMTVEQLLKSNNIDAGDIKIGKTLKVLN